MNVSPVDNIYYNKTSFKAKIPNLDIFFNSKNIQAQLKQIESSGDDTKKLFAGLSALATSAIAGLVLMAENNKDVKTLADNALKEFGLNNTDELIKTVTRFTKEFEIPDELDYTQLFNENPDRNTYLAITSKYFPNLNEKYEAMLVKSLKEPDNERNIQVLGTLETIFSVLTKDKDSLKYKKNYFSVLDGKYNSCIEEVCDNFNSTVLGGNTPMEYLTMLNNERFTKEEIINWANAGNISLKEFLLVRDLNGESLTNISNLKSKNNNFEITKFILTENKVLTQKKYIFQMKFKEGTDLKDKLSTISKFHEAIYGPIYLSGAKDFNDEYLLQDIVTEISEYILKDQRYESLYNFMKYAAPELVSKFQYTSQEIQLLPKEHPAIKELKKISNDYILNLDFSSKKMNDLCNLISDDAMFEGLLQSRHARLRFLTRIVLKDNPDSDIYEACKEKMKDLKDALDTGLDKYYYFCFINTRGLAPRFFLNNTKIGNFVKVTLNRNGCIHTIFEDAKKVEKFDTDINQKK